MIEKMRVSEERIIIRNFGGIRSLDLTLRPFTVLIGPQSVGKSITAKIIFYFKTIPSELFSGAGIAKATASQLLLERFIRLFPDPTYGGGEAMIKYRIEKTSMTLIHPRGAKGKWKIQIPVPLRRAHSMLARTLVKVRKDQASSSNAIVERAWEREEAAQDRYWATVAKVFPRGLSLPRFIPAGRSFYSQIERDFASYFEAATLDPFISEFAKFLAQLKNRRLLMDKAPQAAASAQSLSEVILSGRYSRESSQDFLYLKDGRKLPAKLWSSGQQEAQPLLFVLQRFCEGFYRSGAVFIEEPEAHLFPSSQRFVVELISLAFNSRQPGMQLFLTTHSPYILTTVNNLLQAGQLYAKRLSKSKKHHLQKIVLQDRALLPGSIGAFYMDGRKCTSLIAKDTNLIDTNAIDEVSNELGKQFTELLDVQEA